MFTGIIEAIGDVKSLQRAHASARLTVGTKLATGDLTHIKLGDSIAVMGACLTVVSHRVGEFDFDISLESLQVTTLGELRTGSRVHLERAMLMGGRLDGHIVQGHVDGVATLVEHKREGNGFRLTYELPSGLLGQVVQKGSIAIDGVSLTIAHLEGSRVSVALIPHTSAQTLLTDARVGSRHNIETDILGKYVERVLLRSGSASGGGLTRELLARSGFIR